MQEGRNVCDRGKQTISVSHLSRLRLVRCSDGFLFPQIADLNRMRSVHVCDTIHDRILDYAEVNLFLIDIKIVVPASRLWYALSLQAVSCLQLIQLYLLVQAQLSCPSGICQVNYNCRLGQGAHQSPFDTDPCVSYHHGVQPCVHDRLNNDVEELRTTVAMVHP